MNTKNIINKVGYVFIGIGIFVVIIYIIGIYNIIITNNKLKEQSKVIEYYEETLITREVEVTYYNIGNITSMQENPMKEVLQFLLIYMNIFIQVKLYT